MCLSRQDGTTTIYLMFNTCSQVKNGCHSHSALNGLRVFVSRGRHKCSIGQNCAAIRHDILDFCVRKLVTVGIYAFKPHPTHPPAFAHSSPINCPRERLQSRQRLTSGLSFITLPVTLYRIIQGYAKPKL